MKNVNLLIDQLEKINNDKTDIEAKKNRIMYIVARIITSIILLWALNEHPYIYYTMLRFIVCGVSVYGCIRAIKYGRMDWTWIFGVIAFLFNPIVPIHLDRRIWEIIDIIVAIILIVSIFFMRHTKGTNVNEI